LQVSYHGNNYIGLSHEDENNKMTVADYYLGAEVDPEVASPGVRVLKEGGNLLKKAVCVYDDGEVIIGEIIIDNNS
jgi:hypothetical protein